MQSEAGLNPSLTYYARLDAIRGLAIAWVVMFHSGGAMWGWNVAAWPGHCEVFPAWTVWPAKALAYIAGMGFLGVPIFFVLSGFLIHLTYSRSKNQSVRLFWWRRWSRIYPAYFVALVAFTLWSGNLASKAGREDFELHVLLLHNLKDRTFFGINASFWSLAVEAQLYLLYPLLLQVRNKIGMPALLLTALGVRLAIGIAVELTPGQFGDDPAITAMLPRLWFEWILGMYVADCLLQNRRALAFVPVVAGLCLWVAMARLHGSCWSLGLVPAVSLATATWVDLVVHRPRPATWPERALIPLGTISYSLYLWHQPIVNFVGLSVVQSEWLSNTTGKSSVLALAAILCIAASTAAGAAMYLLVELPAIRLCRGIERRVFAQGAAQPVKSEEAPAAAGPARRRAA